VVPAGRVEKGGGNQGRGRILPFTPLILLVLVLCVDMALCIYCSSEGSPLPPEYNLPSKSKDCAFGLCVLALIGTVGKRDTFVSVPVASSDSRDFPEWVRQPASPCSAVMKPVKGADDWDSRHVKNRLAWNSLFTRCTD